MKGSPGHLLVPFALSQGLGGDTVAILKGNDHLEVTDPPTYCNVVESATLASNLAFRLSLHVMSHLMSWLG